MEEKSLFHNRYYLERLLGRGNFSEVWLAKDTKTDISVALKVYAPATGLDDNGLNMFAREFSLVVNANQKNLLKPLYYDSCDRKPYLVLPYCEQGSIMKLVGRFDEKSAWRLLRDVASGLAWLHAMTPPVIHQDIKPDNIMVGDNGDFMITDFGVSTHLRSTLRKSLSAAFSSAGTIAYMAPERFGKDNTPIMANDIYSLGATVYEMLTGDTPFGDDGGLVQKKGAEVPDLKGSYSANLKKVIRKCLATNPWERPTAEELEKYAADGMVGRDIKFRGEKTRWQKFRIPVAIALVLALCGGIATYNHSQRNAALEAERIRAQVAKAYSDSIASIADAATDSADSLAMIGDTHGEGFEAAYLEALLNYRKAMQCYGMLDSTAMANEVAALVRKAEGVEEKLYAAYISLCDKAKLFATDPEIAGEFIQRAESIKASIDISKYSGDTSGKADSLQ